MNLILNNIKGLGIHLLMTIFSIILTVIYVMISPVYGSKAVAILILVCLYVVYILIYLKLSCYLKLENDKRNDYLVGIFSFIVGIGIWGFTIYYSQCSIIYISEEVAEYWIPYNVYTFPSWLFIYGQKNPLILLLGSLSPGILLSIGMKIRRYKCKLNEVWKCLY